MKSLFDGSDLNGVVHPKDIRYLRYVRFWLKVIGSWPMRATGEATTTSTMLYSYYNLFLPVFCLPLNFAFLVSHVRKWSFLEMGQVYINTLMCALYAVRQFIPRSPKYEKLVEQYLNVMHLFYHKHRSAFAMKMHLRLHKWSNLYTLYIISLIWIGCGFYNAIPLYNNWVDGGYRAQKPDNFSYNYAIDFQLPFDYQRDLKVHIFLSIFNMYATFKCTVSFALYDSLLSLQMFQLWGHLKILIFDMENFPRPVHYTYGPSRKEYSDQYTKEELQDVSQRLKDIVDHHNLIFSNIKNISYTFGPAIAAYYLFQLLANCLLLLEISTGDPKALIRYGILALALLQLQIQTSAVFELVSSMSEKLMRAAYSLPWECMDTANRRSVLLILARCQQPLGVKAFGMVEVGMKTTLSILKTTLSYFIMLRTVAVK